MQNRILIILLLLSGCKQPAIPVENQKVRVASNAIDTMADAVITDFFRGIRERRFGEAMDKLLSSNPYISLSDSATTDLKEKFVGINESAGTYVGNRLLKKRVLGDDLSIYSYIVKYEQKFYRFIFMFYNNGREKRLYKFLFDDDLDVEIETSQKFYTND